MSNALKGALWSGLIWPGLGQVVLKRYKRGFAIVLAVGVLLTVIMVKATQLTLAIVDKIEAQGGPIDLTTISNATAQVSAGTGGPGFNLLSLLMIALWIIAVIDAYRIGRQMDLERGRTAQPPNTGHE
jgi:hypothetical protein